MKNNHKNKSIVPLLIIGLCLTGAFIGSINNSYAEDVSIREKKDQDGYLVNLKDLIKRSKKQIEKVGVKIEEQAKLRRNQQREQKAREYYEKAMRLYEEGEFDKARKYWDKGIKITEHEEMNGYISQSVKKTNKQNKAFKEQEKSRIKQLELERGFDAGDVDKKYKSAVKSFKASKFLEAKVDFEDVEDMFPDHKATRSYLMVIEQEIEKEQQRLIDEKLRQNAIVKHKEKESWRRNLEKQEAMRRAKLHEQAEEIYQDALTSYKAKNFKKAKDRFKEVEWILPDYKSTIKYLSRIDKEIRKHNKSENVRKEDNFDRDIKAFQREYAKEKSKAVVVPSKARTHSTKGVKDTYKEAVSLYKEKLYRQSQAMFYQVESMDSDYKRTQKYLTKIKKIIGQEQAQKVAQKVQGITPSIESPYYSNNMIQEKIEQRYQQFADKANEKYTAAIDFYQRQNFIEAKRKFIETEAIYPNFNETRTYLARIDEDIQNSGRVNAKPKSKSLVKRTVKSKSKDDAPPRKAMKTEPKVDKDQLKKNRKIKANKFKAIDPGNVEGLTKKELRREAEVKYKTAIKLYREKRYVEALEKFKLANGYVEGYKLADQYVAYVERLIKKSNKKLSEESVKEYPKLGQRKVEKVKELEEYRRKDLPPKVDSNRRGIFKKKISLEKSIEDSKARNEREFKERVQVIYDEAVALYKDQRYFDAKLMFNTVYSLWPEYRSVDKYIVRCNDALAEIENDKAEQRDKLVKMNKENEEKLKEKKTKKEKELSAKTIARRKKEVEGVYKQALGLYKNGNYTAARDYYQRFDQLLAAGEFDKKYIKRMQRQVMADKKDVERVKSRAEEKAERLKEKEELRLAKEQAKIKEVKKSSKNDVVKIKKEEMKSPKAEDQSDQDYKKLAKSSTQSKKSDIKYSKDEEELLKQIAKKEQELEKMKRKEFGYSESTTKDKTDKMGLNSKKNKEYRGSSEIDLEKLVIMRQKELKEERARIEKEFAHHLDELYKQAVRLYKEKDHVGARRMFEEINQMKPNYRKTVKYLTSISKTTKPKPRKISMRERFKGMLGQQKPRNQELYSQAAIGPSRANVVSQALDQVERAY